MTPPVGRLPSWIVFQLLERCNLRCTMCYEWGETGAYHAHETTAELDPALVVRTVRACGPATPYFELFGGEPLLYGGIWDVLEAIRGLGSSVAFPTNGLLVEDLAERLVAARPTRIWLSLDGPEAVNDRQRGSGVFQRVVRGLAAIDGVKRRTGATFPEMGVTCVITPANHRHIAELFLEHLDLRAIADVSLELQSFATAAEHATFAAEARDVFGVTTTPSARAYVRDPALFAEIDVDSLAHQMRQVRDACLQRGVRFRSQPRTLDPTNLGHYLGARWRQMTDRRNRCAFPWLYAEVSARGLVTTCHSLYDVPIGNLYDDALSAIWQSEKAAALRAHLRDRLWSMCTACCRYHGDAPVLGR